MAMAAWLPPLLLAQTFNNDGAPLNTYGSDSTTWWSSVQGEQPGLCALSYMGTSGCKLTAGGMGSSAVCCMRECVYNEPGAAREGVGSLYPSLSVWTQWTASLASPTSTSADSQTRGMVDEGTRAIWTWRASGWPRFPRPARCGEQMSGLLNSSHPQHWLPGPHGRHLWSLRCRRSLRPQRRVEVPNGSRASTSRSHYTGETTCPLHPPCSDQVGSTTSTSRFLLVVSNR